MGYVHHVPFMLCYDRWYAEERFFEYGGVRIEGPKVCTAHTAYHALHSGAHLGGKQFTFTLDEVVTTYDHILGSCEEHGGARRTCSGEQKQGRNALNAVFHALLSTSSCPHHVRVYLYA